MGDILVVATEWNSAHGGISSFNRALCAAIASAGRSVTCFVPTFDLDEAADALQVGVRLLKANPPPGVRGKDALLCGLPSRVDLAAVIGHGRITGPAACDLRRKTNSSAPYIHFLHMDPKAIEWEKEPVEGIHPPEVLKQRVDDEVELAKLADLIYAVGPQLTRSFGAYLKPAGRDVNEFRPGIFVSDSVAKAGSSMDCLLFGRVEDYGLKGVDLAAKALRHLVQKRPAEFSIVRLIVLGAQLSQARTLQDRLRKTAPELTVIVEQYTSSRKEVADAILRSSLVLMPSRTEGFGLAALEAISHGVPVLLSSQSGLAEAMEQDVSALSSEHVVRLHVPGAITTLAERIAGKLSNSKLAFDRAAALRAAMAPHFSWEKSATSLLARLDGLSGHGRQGGSSPRSSGGGHPPSNNAEADEGNDTVTETGSAVEQVLDPKDPTSTIIRQFRRASGALVAWPQTLTSKRWLERPQLAEMKLGLLQEEAQRYWLLGPPGSGKSAFLSRLVEELQNDGVAIVGIKADQLWPSVDTSRGLADFLKLDKPVEDLVLAVAAVQRVVIVLDQLDALSDIVDLQTRRLGALLDLLRNLRPSDNVSVVASCRAFDFARDIRFRELQYEEVELAPLAIEQVDTTLAEAGFPSERVSDQLRELVRSPHWLNVFLRLFQNGSNTQFVSHHGLLEEHWRMATRAAGGASEALLTDLAESMSKDETFWVPLAAYADRLALVDRLEHEGILCREGTLVRIGFAHQTFFEFAHARSFVAKKSLAAHVRETGYSLFVRRVVWAALGYLREASPKQYGSELSALADDAAMRMHLRALVLQFIGQASNPTSDEQRVVAQALDDANIHPIAIQAIAGRLPWFAVVKPKLGALMVTRPRSAYVLLHGMVSLRQQEVVALLRQYWLVDRAQHDQIAWVLVSAKQWGRDSVELAASLLGDGELTEHVRGSLLATCTKLVPVEAPRLYAIHLRKLRAERIASIQVDPEPADDAPDVEKMRWHMDREPRKTLAALLHDAADLTGLAELGAQQPREFIDAIWPWYTEVLEQVAESRSASFRFRHVYLYETDPWERSFPVFGSVVGETLRVLATKWPVEWQEFVAVNAFSELDTVHQCILCGFEAAIPSAASLCVEYLVGDLRRLSIGDHSGSDSVRLVAAVARCLEPASLASLAAAIARARLADEADMSVPVDHRRDRREANETHRERLRAALGARERSDLDDERETYGRGTGFRQVDSHVSAAQVARMPDADIINLFSELVDKTEFSHPSRFMSGGSVQLARVLGDVVRKHPELQARYAALAKRFSPATNQRPAASIFEALAETGYGLAASGKLLIELDQLGFLSPEFRWTTAYALEKVASATEAIAPDVMKLLESWLVDAEVVEALPDAGKDLREILWGWGMGGVLPSGNFPTLNAITRLLLLRPIPDPQAWVSVLARHVTRRESPRVWSAMAPRLVNLRLAGLDGANLLTSLFSAFPEVQNSIEGARLVAHARWWVDNDLVEAWVQSIGRSSWRFAKRAFGELVGLLVVQGSNPEWAERELAACLSGNESSDILLGVLTSAAHLWADPESRTKATSLLVAGCRVARSQPERDAIMRSFDLDNENVCDSETIQLLAALQAAPAVLLGHSVTFIERMSKIVVEQPSLTSGLVMSYVQQRLGDDVTKRSEFFQAGPVLANIAVTLHRSPTPLREHGLDLLELLLVSESYGATEVLGDVDRGRL